METKTRPEVPQEDRWNVEAMYKTPDDWEKDFSALINEDQHPRWPEIAAFQGKLDNSPEILHKALETINTIDRHLTQLYTYAHLRHDEDIANDANKSAYNRILTVLHDFTRETSWVEPELLAMPELAINFYLQSPVLADYHFHLEKIAKLRKHTLPKEQESLLALSAQALQSTHKAFSAINDADFDYGSVPDSAGEERPLTHASYSLYLHGKDRTLRENAFRQFHNKYSEYENTLCELLNGTVQSHLFQARARKYPTCLDAALFPNHVDTKVYHTLIDTVGDNLDVMHRYVKVRKELLGVDALHLYDMYVPVVPDVDISIPYKQAEELVIDSVSILGPEYQNLLYRGLKEEKWVDRYENKGKRSGAYSSGCYDSMPYILMNYKSLLRDTFTLAHEAGHSMHSLLSHTHQPYHYSHYSIFLAEVASTFNEELLMQLMLERCQDPAEKMYLINQKIEDIRATFFRQTMFAEFELYIHTMAEKNIPLTPAMLKEHFRNLVAKYFGDGIVIDDEIEIEWARIPHFYYNFYVFQYATGISAPLALADRVTNGGDAEREAYLGFLKGGCSQYPLDLLQGAGIDMRTSKPIEATIVKFDNLVSQLAQLRDEGMT